MVIKQEVLEKIIEIIEGWSDPQMTREQLEAKGREVMKDLGFDSGIQNLTKEQLNVVSEAVHQAKAIYDERISNAN